MAYFRTHRGLVLLIPDYIYRRIRGFLQKNDKVKKLEQLKKSLMQNLLTGKIKIDKDI